MTVATIILGRRAGGPSNMPVPNATYDNIQDMTVTIADESTIVADREDQFWFVIPDDAAIRVLETEVGGTAVTTSTGWPVKAGERWEAKATIGMTLSLILAA